MNILDVNNMKFPLAFIVKLLYNGLHKNSWFGSVLFQEENRRLTEDTLQTAVWSIGDLLHAPGALARICLSQFKEEKL